MKALYSLRHRSASFEFFNWLVLAAARGATEVVFDVSNPKTTKWSRDEVTRRFKSIVEPGPVLLDLPVTFGTDGADIASHNMLDLVEWVSRGNSFTPLSGMVASADIKYTVTLRNVRTSVERNSNEAAWRAFARNIGALVIEDYEDEPIHLLRRFAICAAARMNFGVASGPMHMLTLSCLPVTMYVVGKPGKRSMQKGGIPQGGQYPWLRSNQRMIWQDDTLENLMANFELWRKEREAA